MKSTKRLASALMTICLLFTLLPVSARAETAQEDERVAAPTITLAGVIASGNCGDNLTWTLTNDGTLTISGTGEMWDFTPYNLPWSHNQIVSLVIKDGVTTIGNLAFRICETIKSVSLPDSLVSIGEWAFSYCEGLTSIKLPQNLETIREFAFAGCSSLSRFEADAANPYFCSIDGVLFSKDGSTLISYPNAKGTTYTVPVGTTHIGNTAFDSCYDLHTVILPEGLISIGDNAFSYSHNLTHINFPTTLREIGQSAFNCFESSNQLTEVILPEGLIHIGLAAFGYCMNLETVSLPSSLSDISPWAFEWCSGLTQISIPDGIASIGEGSFGYCKNLATVTIPGSVTSIGTYAFDNCSNLTDVYYSASKEQWSSISIDSYNDSLHRATIHYDSSSDHDPSAGFSARHDGWSFVNGREGFGYSQSYRIPDERYEEVFGAAYVASARKKGGDTLKSMITPDWGGNCYGMSVTAVLFHLGLLDWNDYNKIHGRTHETVNSYYDREHYISNEKGTTIYTMSSESSEITKLIERYQILQNGTKQGYIWGEGSTNLELFGTSNYMTLTDDGSYKHNPNGKYIDNLLHKIQLSDTPLIAHLNYSSGHAIVIRTDRPPKETESGWHRVYIYDPNKPYFPEDLLAETSIPIGVHYSNDINEDEDIYIELNPSLNQWRYYSATIDDITSAYRGSTKSGKVKTFKNAKGKECPELLFVYSLQDVGYPTSFDGTESWLPRWEDKLDVLVIPLTNMTVYSSIGEELCSVVDGYPAIYDDSIEFHSYTGALVGEEGSAATGGRLSIPYGDIRIEYRDGSDITILSSDTAYNVAAEGDVTVDISLSENQFEITSAEDGDLMAQVTEVYSDSAYTSVEADGVLMEGSVLSLQLDKDQLSASITGDSVLTLYTNNEDEPEEQPVALLDSNEVVELEDIRACEPIEPQVELKRADYGIACTVSNLTGEADLILAYYTQDGQLWNMLQMPAVNETYTFANSSHTLTVSAFLLDKNGTPLTEKVSLPD